MKLSGYSHESVEPLMKLKISGGYMRGLLHLAVKDLESEGHKVASVTIDRKEHFYVEV